MWVFSEWWATRCWALRPRFRTWETRWEPNRNPRMPSFHWAWWYFWEKRSSATKNHCIPIYFLLCSTCTTAGAIDKWCKAIGNRFAGSISHYNALLVQQKTHCSERARLRWCGSEAPSAPANAQNRLLLLATLNTAIKANNVLRDLLDERRKDLPLHLQERRELLLNQRRKFIVLQEQHGRSCYAITRHFL